MRDGSWIRVDGYTPAPQNKKMIGYKKCKDNLIVKLEIPEDAKRTSTPSRKCRSDKAVVLRIETLDGIIVTAGRSSFNPKFIYKVGQTIKSDSYNDSSTCGCGNGINFFMSREDALDYIKFL